MTSRTPQKRTAGAFDIRTIIAALFFIYGIVLTVLGLIGGPAETEKAAGLNINLYSGIAMLVFAVLFTLWARLRPIVVSGGQDEEDSAAEG